MKSQRLNGGGIGNLPWYSILSHKQYQTNRSSFLSVKRGINRSHPPLDGVEGGNMDNFDIRS